MAYFFEQLIGFSEIKWSFYLLVFIRMSSLLLITPIFGRKNVPVAAKIGLAFLLTLIVAPSAGLTLDPGNAQPLVWVFLVLKEFTLGLILGYLSLLFFSVSLVAGQVIDIELGLGIGSIFDPQMNMQTAISGQLLNLAMLLYFLTGNGHHRLIKILVASFNYAPVGQVRLSAGLAQLIAGQFTQFFALAVSLMLPLICSALLVELLMGLLMRTMPQLNAYMVGIPFKVLTGLFVLFLLQPVFMSFSNRVFEQMFLASEQVMRQLGGVL